MTPNKHSLNNCYLSLIYTHFFAVRGQTHGLSSCENLVCAVTSKAADLHQTTEREREREGLISSPQSRTLSEKAHQEELNFVLPSFAALRVSLDPSGWADVSRGKHGVDHKDSAGYSLPFTADFNRL